MTRVARQTQYEDQHWLLFRRPGQFFYDYAVRYRQQDFQNGECEIEVPWLGRTFYSWLWTTEAYREMYDAVDEKISALSGTRYAQGDGAVTAVPHTPPVAAAVKKRMRSGKACKHCTFIRGIHLAPAEPKHWMPIQSCYSRFAGLDSGLTTLS